MFAGSLFQNKVYLPSTVLLGAFQSSSGALKSNEWCSICIQQTQCKLFSQQIMYDLLKVLLLWYVKFDASYFFHKPSAPLFFPFFISNGQLLQNL